MIRRFRKKPIIVETVQLIDEKSVFVVVNWIEELNKQSDQDDWISYGWKTTPPTIWFLGNGKTANQNDWIIRINDNFDVCDPEEFVKIYQEV